MRSYLLALALLPLLMRQGARVRSITPTLPEPQGQRHGEAGKGRALSVWIVGDSAAAGVGVSHQREALSGQLVARLSDYARVSWQCHASTGNSASDTALHLAQLPVEKVDVMICSVGVNDVVALRSVRRWRQALKEIHTLARERFADPLLVFSLIPPMQTFPALPFPLNRVLGMHASTLNRALCRYARRYPSILTIPAPVEGVAAMMATDGFHPGAAGYRHWAELIVGPLLATLGVSGVAQQPTDEPSRLNTTINQ